MARLIKEAEVRSLLTMDEALHAIEGTFRQQGRAEIQNVARERLISQESIFNVMFSANDGEHLAGAKLYTVTGEGAHFLVVLFDSQDGSLKALIEADALGQIRTGAASGVATKYLAKSDAHRVTIFGAGWQAASQLLAMVRVRPIDRIYVVGRDVSRRDAFILAMREELRVAVSAAEDAAACVADSDIVITATTSKTPVLKGAWLSPGTHLNLVGSNHPSRQEVDLDLFARADLITVDHLPTAKVECGDLLPAIAAGLVDWKDVRQLGDVVAGIVPGRQRPDQITVFESHGMAAEDVSVAWRCLTLARSRSAGEEIDFLG
jgi:ornithine cyclodeaminase/alanine dehydrogenase-like protein (mu-crystallin family)